MKKTICSLLAVSMIGSMAYAEDTAYTLGLNVGTNGAGIDLSVPMTESLNIRASLNGATYSQSETESDIAYDVTGDLLTVGAILDYYPVQSSQFHISAGAFYNGNQIEANAKSTEEYEIGDETYTSEQIGSLDAALDFDGIAPYLGLGWGYNSNTSGWGFSLDVGAMYHGAPQVAMDVTRGSAIPPDGGANDTLFEEIQAEVEKERQTVEDDISDFKWYPVVRIGVTYKF